MKLSAFFVFFSFSISFAAIADVIKGFDCFHSRDFSCALVEFQQAATKGDAKAKLGLGILYLQGSGVKQDDAKAFDWIHQAAVQKDREAQKILARMYLKGKGVKQDDTKAFEWYQKAGDKEMLGEFYKIGQVVTSDAAKAFEWFERAAAKGDADAQHRLGAMYEIGRGVKQDRAKGFEWIQKAATQGHIEAIRHLGFMYSHGSGVKEDYAKAAEWFQKAATRGDAKAQIQLGILYLRGNGVKQDASKAVEWYQKAAVQGELSAQLRLGEFYVTDRYAMRDYAKAVEWYQMAAAQGNISAERHVMELSETIQCSKSAKTKLFGILIKCVYREELKDSVTISGGKEKILILNKNHRDNVDIYDSATLLKGSSELEIHTHKRRFVKARYTFPSHLDAEQLVRVRDFVANKYGNPTTSSGNPASGKASFEWRLVDGIILSVSRGWPDTTTYLTFTYPENYQAMQAEQERQRKEREAKEYRKQSNAF